MMVRSPVLKPISRVLQEDGFVRVGAANSGVFVREVLDGAAIIEIFEHQAFSRRGAPVFSANIAYRSRVLAQAFTDPEEEAAPQIELPYVHWIRWVGDMGVVGEPQWYWESDVTDPSSLEPAIRYIQETAIPVLIAKATDEALLAELLSDEPVDLHASTRVAFAFVLAARLGERATMARLLPRIRRLSASGSDDASVALRVVGSVTN